MVRRALEQRGLLSMAAAAAIGTWGLSTYPLAADNVYLQIIHLRKPMVFGVLAYGYATLWFVTPFFALLCLTVPHGVL